jgi:hypothetical protein
VGKPREKARRKENQAEQAAQEKQESPMSDTETRCQKKHVKRNPKAIPPLSTNHPEGSKSSLPANLSPKPSIQSETTIQISYGLICKAPSK